MVKVAEDAIAELVKEDGKGKRKGKGKGKGKRRNKRLQKVQAAELVKKEACIDEPEWVDAQGDGCDAYVQAIEKKLLTREEACGEAHASANNQDGAAKLHCRATCRTCKPIQHIIHHK